MFHYCEVQHPSIAANLNLLKVSFKLAFAREYLRLYNNTVAKYQSVVSIAPPYDIANDSRCQSI